MSPSKMLTNGILVFVLSLAGLHAWAAEGAAPEGADPIDWALAQKQMASLSQMGFHPFLMPLIMENRDAIGLTDRQVKIFRAWSSKNRVPLIAAMNKIIQARIAFQRISLNPKTTEEVLFAKQEEIFKMYRKVLNYQLSCRRNILDTFTDEQWDNFRFVLIESGYALD